MISTQYINLNMTPSGVMPVLYCSQYDIGRPLGMVVYNGSEPVNLDAYTCTIEATRTDGTAITAAVITDGNIGAFVTTATMTNQSDKYQAKLVLFDSNSRRVASLAFVMVVTAKTMDENAESIQEDESLYQQFTGTVQTLIADIREDIVQLGTDIDQLKFDKVQRYDTVAQMAADTDLTAGMYAQTGGYYAAHDGGGALYRIESSVTFIGAVTLSNGLTANLVDRDRVNALALGFHRNDGTDNHTLMQTILDYKESNLSKVPLTLVFPCGTYAFSPTKIQSWALTLEGEGNPFGTPSRFLSTVFVPVADQDYIIMMGSEDTTAYLDSYVYIGNAIKRIQFRCNKYGTSDANGTANNWRMNLAMLVIYRQYMSEFNDIALYYSYGPAMRMASSWECIFGGTLMVRNVFAPDSGAVVFGTDFLGGTTVSDTSSMHFNNIELEAVVGSFFNFERACNFENNIFGSIMVEDYRLDMPDRPAANRWGTEWTSNTWLPSGVTEPDVVLPIFNFEEGAYYSNNTINNITASMFAVRSYYYNNVLYTHTAIVKCSGFPKRLDFQCSLLNVQYNRTDVQTLIFPYPYTPKNLNFVIDNAVLNDNAYNYKLDGYCRNYEMNDIRAKNPLQHNYGYRAAADVCVASNIQKYSTEVISGENTQIFSPLIVGNDESYAEERVCFTLPNKDVFPSSGSLTQCRIPITGNTLHVRIYQAVADTMYYSIYAFDGTQQKVDNLASYGAGWQWATIDTSEYIGDYCVSFSNRVGDYPNNFVDVYFWT